LTARWARRSRPAACGVRHLVIVACGWGRPSRVFVTPCAAQAYGIVWKAIDKKTRKTVALKKIFDAFQNSTDAQRTFRVRQCAADRPRADAVCRRAAAPRDAQEIMFLQELNQIHHDNIIRLLNVLKADNDKDIYLVFECMGAPCGALRGAVPAAKARPSARRMIFSRPSCTGGR
jgi:hypothetical protein